MSEWQPIETAPEHEEVLIYRDDCGVLMGQKTYLAEILSEAELEEGDFDEEAIWALDWFGGDSLISERLEGEEVPTHWMLLPEPPK